MSVNKANAAIKSGTLLSLAERVAVTTVTLARDSGLSEKDAEDILRLAGDAVSLTTHRGFGEQNEPVANQELIESVANILSYLSIKSTSLPNDSEIKIQVERLIPALDALLDRYR